MMDQKNADEWLAKAKTAMEDAAPGIVASVDDLLEQRAAILEVGYRAAIQAAMHDMASEMIGRMLRELPLAKMDGGGLVAETAVRRFTN